MHVQTVAALAALIYGVAFESVGAAVISQTRQATSVWNGVCLTGACFVVLGGVLCAIAAREPLLSPVEFVTVGAAGVPAAILLSAAAAKSPRHFFLGDSKCKLAAGVAVTLVGVITTVIASESGTQQRVEPPFPGLFWCLLVATPCVGVRNCLTANRVTSAVRATAIITAAGAGCLTLALVWTTGTTTSPILNAFLAVCILPAATLDLALNATSIRMNGTALHTPAEFALWHTTVTLVVAPYTRNTMPEPSLVIVAGVLTTICGVATTAAAHHV